MATSFTHLMNRVFGLFSLILALSGLWFVLDGFAQPGRSGGWIAIGLVLLAVALAGRKLLLLGVRRGEGVEAALRPDFTETVTGSGGCQLHVAGFGAASNPLIILTAGWGCDASLWDGVARVLAKRFQVIVWDPAGTGVSTRPFDGHYTIARFAGDLKAVLALGEGRPALLVGHGLGGMAVLDLCASDPAKSPREVAGVVVLDTVVPDAASAAPHAVFPPLWRLDVWLSPLMQLMAWTSFLNGSAHLVARTRLLGPDPSRETLDHIVRMSARQAPCVQAKGLEAGRIWRFDPRRLRTALLVATGQYDGAAPSDAGERLARAVCDGRFETIDGAGQMGPLEAPGRYAEAIERHADLVFTRAEDRRKLRESERLRARSPAWSVAAEPASFKAEAPEPEPPRPAGPVESIPLTWSGTARDSDEVRGHA